jgi:hypothetical protein
VVVVAVVPGRSPQRAVVRVVGRRAAADQVAPDAAAVGVAVPVVAEVVVAAGAVADAAAVLAEPAHQASGRRIAELSDVQWIQSGITCLTGPGAPRWRLRLTRSGKSRGRSFHCVER